MGLKHETAMGNLWWKTIGGYGWGFEVDMKEQTPTNSEKDI